MLLCYDTLKDEKLVLLMPRFYPPCGYKPSALDISDANLLPVPN